MNVTISSPRRIPILLVCLVSSLLLPDVLPAASGEMEQSKRWLNAWRETTPMQKVRSSAAFYTANGVIYMIGGIGGEVVRGKAGEDMADATTRMFMRSTEFARIRPDGSLSEWKAGPELNEKRGYFSAAGKGRYIYVAGGAHGAFGKTLLDSVERAEIRPDGTLGPWQLEKQRLNIPRRCVKLVVVGDYLYAFGGFGGILLDTVERARIQPDGSLGEWLVENNRFTMARYIQGVARVGDGVFQIGGHNKETGSGFSEVEWSRPDQEGFFAPWSSTAPLQKGRFGPAIAVRGGAIYALGGLAGPAYLDSVERTSVNGDGRLSPWRYTTPLPKPLEGAAALVAGENIYVIGGANRSGFQNTVYYASFNQEGEIGYLASAEEAARHDRAVAEKAKRPPLPNQGVVLEHIRKAQYSYLKVEMDNGARIWLAGPEQDLNPGDRVGFSAGMVMRNFHSKSLDRTFPSILFVGEIRAVKGAP